MYYYYRTAGNITAAAPLPSFETISQQIFGASSNTHNLSVTTSGTNRLLVVCISITSATDILTSATYNGVALTFPAAARVVNSPAGITSYLGFLINPTIGTNTLTVNFSASVLCSIQAGCYSNANQSSQFGVIATNTANGTTSITGTLTTAINNSWVVMGAMNNSANYAAGTLTTLRGAGQQVNLFDSNGPITPVGVRSLVATSISAQHNCIIATIHPL